MPKQLKKDVQGLQAAKKYAERNLDGRLLEHTRGSVETARKLAHRFGLDEENAVIASYLHDIAKPLKKDRQIAMAGEMGMAQAEIDSYPLAVLHGPLGALIAQKELGIEDAEVLQAILAHSTGCAGMCDIAKVVFIADYIEETRSFPGAKELRSRGDVTLDEFTTAILRRKLNHLIEYNRDIDPRAIDLWNDLMKGME
jgi:predicted HD superfamily hydrolase involved in NAD metabolism